MSGYGPAAKLFERRTRMPTKVMIVDDAVFMRNMIRDALGTPEFQVVTEAVNGVEALEKFKENRVDLVTMDIVMPFRSGIETTREIRKLDQNVIIIVCSALGQETLVMEALEAGANDFIVKPFRQDEVLKVIHKALAARLLPH
jgi:two-component system chemotaxis response regulator CheY